MTHYFFFVPYCFVGRLSILLPAVRANALALIRFAKPSGALHLKSLVSLLKPGVLVYANNDAGSEVVARCVCIIQALDSPASKT